MRTVYVVPIVGPETTISDGPAWQPSKQNAMGISQAFKTIDAVRAKGATLVVLRRAVNCLELAARRFGGSDFPRGWCPNLA